MLARLSSVLAAYLLGAIPFGYLIVRWRKGIDVRETGSHSTGATNVMRNLGIAGFVATLLLDAGKGRGAVWLASSLTHQDPCWTALAAFGAITGHIFPVWLGFRGGKGVATGVGAFLLLAPAPTGLALALFAVVLAAWRYVSLGSITAAASFPVFVYLLKSTPRAIVAGAAASAVLIIARHHANIRRLINGTESQVGCGSVRGS